MFILVITSCVAIKPAAAQILCVIRVNLMKRPFVLAIFCAGARTVADIVRFGGDVVDIAKFGQGVATRDLLYMVGAVGIVGGIRQGRDSGGYLRSLDGVA